MACFEGALVVDCRWTVCQAETFVVGWILLRLGTAVVAVIQLTTARERDLSIKWFLDVRAMVFLATSRALGLDVGGPDHIGPTAVTANQQHPAADALPPHPYARFSASVGGGTAP